MNKVFRIMFRIDDAMVLANQLLARVLRDRAELVVNESELPSGVGRGNNGVLIERGLQINQFLQPALQLLLGLAHFLVRAVRRQRSLRVID